MSLRGGGATPPVPRCKTWFHHSLIDKRGGGGGGGGGQYLPKQSIKASPGPLNLLTNLANQQLHLSSPKKRVRNHSELVQDHFRSDHLLSEPPCFPS